MPKDSKPKQTLKKQKKQHRQQRQTPKHQVPCIAPKSQYSHCTNNFGSLPFSVAVIVSGMSMCGLRSVCMSWQNGSAFQRKYAILNFQFTSESNLSYSCSARESICCHISFFLSSALSLFLYFSSLLFIPSSLNGFPRREAGKRNKKLHTLTANRQNGMFTFQTARVQWANRIFTEYL